VAAEQSGLHRRADGLHACDRGAGLLCSFAHAVAFIHPGEPGRERRACLRRISEAGNTVEIGRDAEVCPAKLVPAEPVCVAELAGQPFHEAGDLAGGVLLDLRAGRFVAALEVVQLAEAPTDRLKMRVHDVFDDPALGPRGRISWKERRLRPFVLYVFEDDRGIEQGDVPVN
jgi:hypothetical protein